MKSISVTECMKKIVNSGRNKNEAAKGTKLHDIFDNFLKTKKKPTNLDNDEIMIFNMFIEFLNDFNHCTLFGSEKEIEYLYKSKKIKGKIDAIFYDEKLDEIHIVDWKITSNLSFETVQQYGCVLNIYAGMFQKLYPEYKKIKLYLVLLHQQNMSYILVPIQLLKLTLDQILAPVFEE